VRNSGDPTGVPDRLLGEAVVAHVAAVSGYEFDPGALRRLAERVEDYKVPRRVEVHAELPRTALARSIAEP